MVYRELGGIGVWFTYILGGVGKCRCQFRKVSKLQGKVKVTRSDTWLQGTFFFIVTKVRRRSNKGRALRLWGMGCRLDSSAMRRHTYTRRCRHYERH